MWITKRITGTSKRKNTIAACGTALVIAGAFAATAPVARADGGHGHDYGYEHDHEYDRDYRNDREERQERRMERRIERKITRKIRRHMKRRHDADYGVRKTVVVHKTVVVTRPPLRRKAIRRKTVRHVYRQPDYRPYNTGIDAEWGGRIIGAILGAATGSQFGKGKGRTVAILSGAVLGTVIGGNIGSRMEAADRARSQEVLESSATGSTVRWRNPDSGVSYQMTPTRTYRNASRAYCREYTTWVVIDGYEEEAHGTACRLPDGTWQPANEG